MKNEFTCVKMETRFVTRFYKRKVGWFMKIVKVKLIGLVCAITGVVLSIIGLFVTSHLAESAKGATVTSYITSTGEQVSSGRLGGNNKQYEVASNLHTFFIFLLIAAIIYTLVIAIQYLKVKNAKTFVEYGEVIDKKMLTVVIQLNNGQRKECFVESGINMIKGDRGTIHIKNNFIIRFEPNTP